MKIGILDCDHLHPSLQGRFGAQYSTMFKQEFLALDPSLTFVSYSAVDGQLPPAVDEADAWLITGSKHDAYSDVPWVVALRDWIVQAHAHKTKVVGICFGHQAIAKALGADVGKSERGWGAGRMCYTILQHQPWMDAYEDQIAVLVSHQDQVHTLPPGAKLLAGDAFCPIYSYQVGEHILGIQGHPEFSKDYDRAILELRRPLLGEEVYAKAWASLEEKINSDTIMRWILRFMQA